MTPTRTGQSRHSGKGLPKGKGGAQLALAEAGLTPLEFMLAVMRDPNEDPQRRDRMAQAAAPYCHAKLAPKVVDPDEVKTLEQNASVASWEDLLN